MWQPWRGGGGGETRPERYDQQRALLQSWIALNVQIKFRTSGSGGLDRARHTGVSSVSHDRLSHIRPRPLGAGYSDSAESQRAAGHWTAGRCVFVLYFDCRKNIFVLRRQCRKQKHNPPTALNLTTKQHSTAALKGC